MAHVKFRQRHDEIAHQRQKRLAQLLCLFNVVVASGSGALMVHYQWNPEPTQAEVILLIGLVSFSWLFLLIAAGTLGWLADLPSAIRQGPLRKKPSIDHAFLSQYRMGFYYAGVILNLLAFAVVAEVTGGLTESPFTALVIAFVLTSEQISRFRPQAKVMFGIGVVVVALMIAFEGTASDPPTLAPHLLYLLLIVAALLGGGLLTIWEKPRNHYVHKLDDPSQLLVYRDAYGNWRFAIYDESHRQDPVVLAADGVDAADFPTDLEARVIECASQLISASSWEKGKGVPDWPPTFSTCFYLELRTSSE